jgi:hypothetical protein
MTMSDFYASNTVNIQLTGPFAKNPCYEKGLAIYTACFYSPLGHLWASCQQIWGLVKLMGSGGRGEAREVVSA